MGNGNSSVIFATTHCYQSNIHNVEMNHKNFFIVCPLSSCFSSPTS